MIINLHRIRYGIILGVFIALIPFFHKFGTEKQVQPKARTFQNGAYLSWEEVQDLLPRFGYATVIDYDTRKFFHVQRRAGQYHADVQPLTAEDTAVMKEICGTWSWKRRAVIVQLESGQRIAASMACMPHGAGAIKGNHFNGHFCIHFRDSKTHASNNKDLAHQIMIWKAAGIVDSQLLSRKAEDTIRIFFTAVGQGDRLIPGRIMLQDEHWIQAESKLLNIQSVRINGIRRIDEQNYSVWLQLTYYDNRKEFIKKAVLELIYTNKGWKIKPSSLLKLIT